MNDPGNGADKTGERDRALFMHLVMMMASSAMQHMGKTLNPLTGKAEVDLDGAGFAIDMLSMIETMTAGNRDPDQDRLLNAQLSALRLNFVETRGASGQSATDSAATSAAETAPQSGAGAKDTPEAPSEAETAAGENASNQARYHKSYG